MFTCPVCYYDKLEYPPADWHICPCCGVEFEYDDCGRTHAELRERWIAGGARWWSKCTNPPADWDTRMIEVRRSDWERLIVRLQELESIARKIEPYRTWFAMQEESDAWDSLSSEALAGVDALVDDKTPEIVAIATSDLTPEEYHGMANFLEYLDDND